MTDLSPLAASVTQRFSSIGKKSSDSLEGRGYDRIWRYKQNLLFGAGEGADYRFGRAIEMHSTLGTVLFSYGMPGFLFFCRFLCALYKVGGPRWFKYVLPACVMESHIRV